MSAAMPRPDCFYQDTLFKGTIEDLVQRSGATIDDLKAWRTLGLLSFDIDTRSLFRESEMIEAEFVAHVVNSEVATTTALRMLAALEKPYCYEHKRIYWHPSTSSWKVRPESYWEGWVDTESFEFIAQRIDRYIGVLAESKDIEELESLRRRIWRALEYAGSDDR